MATVPEESTFEDDAVEASDSATTEEPGEEGEEPSEPGTPDKSEYPEAAPVPGRPEFVFSPYNNEIIDVADIPSGTLVMDPRFPPEEKKYFRVP